MPVIALVSSAPLSLDEHVAAVSDASHGAIASFVGLVRDHDPSVEGTVTHLEYSAHPDAQAVLARIAAEVESRTQTVVAVTHRIGTLAVGEAAIIAAAAHAHRAGAFAACRELVERIKAEVPLWKREVMADGSHNWVGLQ
jgi:molybdopterin synthase catalytic subunit